jgi:hypothetical protein
MENKEVVKTENKKLKLFLSDLVVLCNKHDVSIYGMEEININTNFVEPGKTVQFSHRFGELYIDKFGVRGKKIIREKYRVTSAWEL